MSLTCRLSRCIGGEGAGKRNADEWIARLDAAGADFLYVEAGDEPERVPDPGWEYRMASANPDRFRLLFDDGRYALFEIVKK